MHRHLRHFRYLDAARSYEALFATDPISASTSVKSSDRAVSAAQVAVYGPVRRAKFELHECAEFASAEVTYTAAYAGRTKTAVQHVTLGSRPKALKLSCVDANVAADGNETSDEVWLSHDTASFSVEALPSAGVSLWVTETGKWSRRVRAVVGPCVAGWDGRLVYTAALDSQTVTATRNVALKPSDGASGGDDEGAVGLSGECKEPSTPRNVQAVSLDGASAVVTWDAPELNGGAPVTRYDVRYREQGAAAWTRVAASAIEWPVGEHTGSRRASVSGLLGGTTYEVQVRAVNAVGAGVWSSSRAGSDAVFEVANLLLVNSIPKEVRVEDEEWTQPLTVASVTATVELRTPDDLPIAFQGRVTKRGGSAGFSEWDATYKVFYCARPWSGEFVYVIRDSDLTQEFKQTLAFGEDPSGASAGGSSDDDASGDVLNPCAAQLMVVDGVDPRVKLPNASQHTETFDAPSPDDLRLLGASLSVQARPANGLQAALDVGDPEFDEEAGEWAVTLSTTAPHWRGSVEYVLTGDGQRAAQHQHLSLGKRVVLEVAQPLPGGDATEKTMVLSMGQPDAELFVAEVPGIGMETVVKNIGHDRRSITFKLRGHTYWSGKVEIVARLESDADRLGTLEFELGSRPTDCLSRVVRAEHRLNKASGRDVGLHVESCPAATGAKEYLSFFRFGDTYDTSDPDAGRPVTISAEPAEHVSIGDYTCSDGNCQVRITATGGYWSGTVSYRLPEQYAPAGRPHFTRIQELTLGRPISVDVGSGNDKIDATVEKATVTASAHDAVEHRTTTDEFRVQYPNGVVPTGNPQVKAMLYALDGTELPDDGLEVNASHVGNGHMVMTLTVKDDLDFWAGTAHYVITHPGYGEATAEAKLYLGRAPHFVVPQCFYGQHGSAANASDPICYKREFYFDIDEMNAAVGQAVRGIQKWCGYNFGLTEVTFDGKTYGDSTPGKDKASFQEDAIDDVAKRRSGLKQARLSTTLNLIAAFVILAVEDFCPSQWRRLGHLDYALQVPVNNLLVDQRLSTYWLQDGWPGAIYDRPDAYQGATFAPESLKIVTLYQDASSTES